MSCVPLPPRQILTQSFDLDQLAEASNTGLRGGEDSGEARRLALPLHRACVLQCITTTISYHRRKTG